MAAEEVTPDEAHPRHDLGKIARGLRLADPPLAQLEGLARHGYQSPPGEPEPVTLEPDPEAADDVAEQRRVISEVATFFEAVKQSVGKSDVEPGAPEDGTGGENPDAP